MLLDILCENLYLIGIKKGCDYGQCGVCIVLVNGCRFNVCLMFVVMYQGVKIIIIEGLGLLDNFYFMQVVFIKYDGFQCGYCIFG